MEPGVAYERCAPSNGNSGRLGSGSGSAYSGVNGARPRIYLVGVRLRVLGSGLGVGVWLSLGFGLGLGSGFGG